MAIAIAVLLAGSGLAALAAINLVVLWIALAYLGINLAYSLGAKHVALVDVFLVSAGYVIRVVAGAVAIGALPSPWLYATTAAGRVVHRTGPALCRGAAGRGRSAGAAPGPGSLFRAPHRPAVNHFGNGGLVKLYSIYCGGGQFCPPTTPCS